ncbi:aromatic amino acid transport family protein [Vibrio aestuarianus]|uniref:aromatic amino acid transport family protein n=1 Tax=Vibrio aestuarianus TaxID=28171 RepID=UPI0021C2697D|nr:aromatic amino acid transport family protein [Vibrio aestuarianus]MDE1211041.1 aromatic amino acid transporter [Vibrio aestuarianus]MDE1254877.1 aromatic amino acid transporter [Vibrio aestuarianus]MDE1316069.1 aromatic amino acid transporter [Vibrio aestuarianus]MDE1319656.1 aromatic amino acid transporter [Vibrio aestuarianus]CAH8238804.1 Tyrosine-specific transport protein [Vibrio aestuarianus]
MTQSKIFGSTLIIAGTTIGAGMLALPLASAGIGFTTSLFIMISLWGLMAFTALLMVEIHQYADKDATLHSLAKQILGEKGKWVASFAMLFLFYSLCAAYIAGGGAQFTHRLTDLAGLDISNSLGTLIFTLVVAVIVTVGTSTVDKVNRLLFAGKMIAMIAVLTFLAPNVSQSYLLSMPLGQGLVVAAIPVIFTSFGFHGSIPAIVKYLDGDTPSLRKAILCGSAIPLVIYIFWQLVTLGVVSQPELVENSGLSALIVTLGQTVHQSNLSSTIGIFADLALLTSFLGVSLGLFEFMGDTIKKKKIGANRTVAAIITFVPPLVFALFYPQGFIIALGYAAIALTILAIFLPVVMVIKVRNQEQYNGENQYQVKGGKVALTMTAAIGLMIITSQVFISLGVLPSLG